MATNRRDALKRGFALLGGAIGIGAAGKGGAAAQERTPEIEQSKQLIFHARRLRIGSHDLRRGELPQAGIRMLAYADIVAGLSNDEIERLAALIRAISARGTGVLLVEHHADLIFEICDQVTVLNLGRILAAGTPAEIRVHKEVVSAYLGG